MTGFVLFVRNVPIFWRSKSQGIVTLLSTEAKWYALSEAVKEVIFVVQLIKTMGIQVQIPVTVRVDNVGAVFMAKNITTTGCNKHVYIRTKYVNDYVEYGMVKIIFVKTEDNLADCLTKNLGSSLHTKHSDKDDQD